MTKRVTIAIGAIVLSASAVGMYISKQAVKQQLTQLNHAFNSRGAFALEIDTLNDNLLTQSHRLNLLVKNTEITLIQTVTHLPWGAKAKVTLDENSTLFNAWRQHTDFTQLPMNIEWSVNAVAQQVILNASMAAFEIKSVQPEQSFELKVKPAFVHITSDLKGINTTLNAAIQGFQLQNETFDIHLSVLSAKGTSAEAMGLPLISDSVVLLGDFTVANHDNREAFERFRVSKLNYTVRSNVVQQQLELDSVVKIGDISVQHAPVAPNIAEYVSLENVSFRVAMRNIGARFIEELRIFNAIRQSGAVPKEERTRELGAAFFAESKNMEVSMSTDNLAVTLNGQQNGGAINIVGSARTAPTDLTQIQQDSERMLLRNLKANMDVSIARSLADLATHLSGMPYQPFIEQGVLTETDQTLNTHIEYQDMLLTANSKPLIM